MSKPLKQTSQAGFTLVELAIVMIIIGLLIAGVLGELIANARVTSTVAQIKGIDAATSTFKDTYAALPGDMTAPTTRLPNCGAAPCSVAGNGDGKLANVPGTGPDCWNRRLFLLPATCRSRPFNRYFSSSWFNSLWDQFPGG